MGDDFLALFFVCLTFIAGGFIGDCHSRQPFERDSFARCETACSGLGGLKNAWAKWGTLQCVCADSKVEIDQKGSDE